MRWPFSIFTRGSHPAGAAPDDAADAVSPGTADDARGDVSSPTDAAGGVAGDSRFATRDAGPAAWSSLPAVQRTMGPAPLTAPALPFARRLAGQNGPEPTLAPLAHEVATGGATGLVGGLAMPLVQRAAGTAAAAPDHAPADLPVAAGPHAGAGAHRTAGSRGSGASVAALPPRSAGEPAVALPIAATPPRVLATVEAPEIALDATHVAAVSAPALVRATAPVVTDDAGRATVDAAAGAVPAPAQVSAVRSASAHSLAADGALPAAAPDAGASPPPALVGRRSLGESRRLGLGAPLASRPAVQRVAEAGPSLPLAGHGRTAHAAATATTAPPPTSLAIPAAGAAAALPLLRSLPEGTSGTVGAPVEASGPAAVSATSGPGPAAAGGRADLPLASDPARRLTDRARATPPSANATAGPEATPADDASAPGALTLAGPMAVAQRSAIDDAGAALEAPADGFAAASAPASAPAAGESTLAQAVETTGGSPTAGAPAAVGPSAPVAAHPLAGARPTVQRVATMPLTVPGVAAAGRSSTVAEPALVMVGGLAGRASTAGPAGSVGVTSPGAAFAGAAPAGAAPAVPFGPGAAGTAASVGPAWVGPSLDSYARSGGHAPSGRASSAGTSGAIASAGGYPSAGAMPLVARRSLDVTDAAAPASWSDGTLTSTVASPPPAADGGGPAPAGVTGPGAAAVQRAVTINEMTTSVAPDQGLEGAAGGAGGTQDIDALADQLYPKVRDRLTLDLLLERERAGILGDW